MAAPTVSWLPSGETATGPPTPLPSLMPLVAFLAPGRIVRRRPAAGGDRQRQRVAAQVDRARGLEGPGVERDEPAARRDEERAAAGRDGEAGDLPRLQGARPYSRGGQRRRHAARRGAAAGRHGG